MVDEKSLGDVGRMQVIIAKCTVTRYVYPTYETTYTSTSQMKSAASTHIYTESMLAFEHSFLHSPNPKQRPIR